MNRNDPVYSFPGSTLQATQRRYLQEEVLSTGFLPFSLFLSFFLSFDFSLLVIQ